MIKKIFDFENEPQNATATVIIKGLSKESEKKFTTFKNNIKNIV